MYKDKIESLPIISTPDFYRLMTGSDHVGIPPLLHAHPITFRGSMDRMYLAVKKFQRGYHNNPEKRAYSILINKFWEVDNAYLCKNRAGLMKGIRGILETLAIQ